jgi:hypothetical protein
MKLLISIFKGMIYTGAAVLVYKWYKGQNRVYITHEKLPDGTNLTGNYKTTRSGAAPGDEVVGYGVKDWAEVEDASGYKRWIEVFTGSGTGA